jgi:phosphohistidine swiveling domain-containing protein
MTTPGDEFPVAWLEPGDAELTWDWDDMHVPGAVTPLAGDYACVVGEGFAYGYERLEVPYQVHARVWNHYVYYAFTTGLPDSEAPSVADAYTKARRQAIEVADAYWQERAIPELKAIYDWVATRPVEASSLGDLAETWDEVWRRITRAWSIHFYAIRGPYQVMDDLADFYESVIDGARPGEALELIGGSVHELHEVERGLENLVTLARATPSLERRLGEPGVTLASLAALPEATDFVDALQDFLLQHGHLGQSFDDLGQASWIEAPDLFLTELAKRLEHPPAVDAESRRQHLADQADLQAERVRAALVDDPERLARFETLLEYGRQIGPLTEVHNYWIDRRAQSSLRRFVMRVGRRLAEIGVIEEAADCLYLYRVEVPAILRGPSDQRALVAERRASHAAWSKVRPPRTVGKPAVSDATNAANADRFDGPRYASTELEIRGTGASAGIVRGPARVTLSQSDFGAVQAGDIIVCPSSNPSWVPLFAIAGGLITDTGGVLSHAAVVAREFALPAVVGTGDATQRIADGRLVELDGTSGIVRLL